MPRSEHPGSDELSSEDAGASNTTRLEVAPLPGARRLLRSDDKLTDEDCNPEIFPLVHEGAAKWSIHDPESIGHWVVQPLTGQNLLLAAADGIRLPELAEQDTPLLITGAEGTGKQELARLIASHAQNPRRDKPFEVVDCEAMPPTDIAVDLFGRGNSERNGKLIDCNGGTVLVRRIERLPPDCQRRLIHFITRQEVMQIDADRKRDDVDVRLLATANLDGNGNLPNLGKLGELFVKEGPLPSLREMNWAIPELVSESLRPYAVVRDVYVNWLLDLMCHAWPGNIGELRRYCEKMVMATASKHCSVLNGTAWPVAASNGYPPEFVPPSHIASSLLALSEWKLRETTAWPKTDIPDVFANSLRLLVQISNVARYDFKAWDPERWFCLRRPYYFHPYAIPLELFQGGSRTPVCYDLSAVYPDKTDCTTPLHGLLLGLADLAVNPSKLTTDDSFRAAFGTNPGLIETLRPSESFLNWVGWLKASVPKYSEMRQNVTIPRIETSTQREPTKPKVRERTSDHKDAQDDTRGFFKELRIDPTRFKWADVKGIFHKADDRITFMYGEFVSGPLALTELPGIGEKKSKGHLKKEGVLFQSFLKYSESTFTLDHVQEWCSVNKDSASERLRCLNIALWHLFLNTQPDKKRCAIIRMKTGKCYRVMFKFYHAGRKRGDDPDDIGQFLRERTTDRYTESAALGEGFSIRKTPG